VTTRPTPEERVLRALDELRDAMGAVLAARSTTQHESVDGLVTLSEAARRLCISRSTATRWADTGRLRAVGPTHARRVPLAEIRRLLAADTPAHPAPPPGWANDDH
jgi:excisionase family DNA binding protein